MNWEEITFDEPVHVKEGERYVVDHDEEHGWHVRPPLDDEAHMGVFCATADSTITGIRLTVS